MPFKFKVFSNPHHVAAPLPSGTTRPAFPDPGACRRKKIRRTGGSAEQNRLGGKSGLQRCPFCVSGIAEDIGVRANGGMGGAHTAPLPALQALLNVQEGPLLSGKDIALAGILECTFNAPEKPEDLRKAVEEIDQVVATLIEKFVSAGKIPIVVGGGHNNAFGLLAGSATALIKPLCAINMDAHSDFRRAEGRHSGNGFRYAFEKGYLKRYAPFGLHRNYNSESILEQLEHNTADFFSCVFRRSFYYPNAIFRNRFGPCF